MNYDIIVIGSGPGGYVAAIRASQLGFKTAIIEKENLGGICLNWGCIPTKALLKSAQVYDYLKHAGEYGIQTKETSIEFDKIIGRSRQVADGMSKGIQFLMKKNNIEVINGFGKILAPGKVEITAADNTKKTIQAKHIIIATGARSRQLPNIKQDGKKIIGYREAMTLPTQPQSMLVIGSGAIGTEFSYFYHTLGTKVTMVEFMPQIMPFEDEETSKTMERIFKKQGLNIMVNSSVEKVDTSGEGCKVLIKTPKGEETISCDIVLSAVGVEANIEGMGLEAVGIKTDKGKILTDTYYQTNVPGIYAIGDVIPGPALAHLASHEGIVCVEKIAGKTPDPVDYKNIPACTYTQPEVASVGYTEKKAIEAGYEIKVGKFPFSASGKAKASGHSDGFVKLIFDAKYGELLGAHMVGANVTEMIAEIVVLRKLETTGHEIISSIHPHPTMSEAVMEAAAAAYGEVIHL
ncbi:MAG: dihydrolipoyl dehydrogenase [Candidatus Competibacteraceae bacterium]|nr:dihydrolipoyl dehydrogenase [Candidatus Competibacteraceae bacterium]